jgi:ribosomal protein L11 methyltransferase
MQNFVQLTINVSDNDTREQLIALLSLMKFDGFEEHKESIVAYTDEAAFSQQEVETIINQFNLTYSTAVLPQQNWNALWESNFEPVVVDDFCAIRADFHEPFTRTKHEIVITPKMSFGTGHHATTYLMISDMREIDFRNKSVADFGTGTGVLAILAEKLGAEKVLAIDYDEWSIENTNENIIRNGCENIQVVQADNFSTNTSFDIILANINKNVILENVQGLVDGLQNGGVLLLSGLLTTDETDVVTAFHAKGLTRNYCHERNNWITISLTP